MRLNLKMSIISKYGNQANFARGCGRSDDWISRIIIGRRDPDREEKQLIIKKLEIKATKDIKNLFLDTKLEMVAK